MIAYVEILMPYRKAFRRSSLNIGPGMLFVAVYLVLLMAPAEAQAQMSAAEEMARKLADPLANIHAILNENDVFFFDSMNGQKNGEIYSLKLTPVRAIDFKEKGFSVIPRAIVPLNGRYRSPSDRLGRIWGLGDIALQIFYSPATRASWKWGIGPQFSFKTSRQPELGGIGNGIGLSGVFVGHLSSQISLSVLVCNNWSYDGKYSVSSIQPILSYHFKSFPGLYINYRQATTINWKAEGKKVTLPLGAGIGRTWMLSNRGHGFDFNFGMYFYPIRQDGAPLWSLKFGISILLP